MNKVYLIFPIIKGLKVNILKKIIMISLISLIFSAKLYSLTREEMIKAEDQENYFKISPDVRDLNYDQYFSKGNVNLLAHATGTYSLPP